MSANPPKHDAWPAWRDVRFVLVRSPGYLRPCRGLVLDWRRVGGNSGSGRRWEAMTVFYDDTAQPVTKMAWLPAEQLIPVRVDPNLWDERRPRIPVRGRET